jgi:hypothetical protein
VSRKRPGREADPSPLLVPRSINKLEIYHYSSYRPSWPVKRVQLFNFYTSIFPALSRSPCGALSSWLTEEDSPG